MDYIDKLDEAGVRATVGPWHRVGFGVHSFEHGIYRKAIFGEGFVHSGVYCEEPDAAFIALARNVWPELVAVVREAGKLRGVCHEGLANALDALAAKVGGEGNG